MLNVDADIYDVHFPTAEINFSFPPYGSQIIIGLLENFPEE